MNAQEEFILFLEKNPAYYVIMKSPLYLDVLEALSKKPISITQLKTLFPRVDSSDLSLIVESLLEIGLLSKFRAGENLIQYTNDQGKEFLEKYNRTRGSFVGKKA